MTNVYFISGMGASCSVFDKIILPEEYVKQYLEWRAPSEKETLDHYAKSYAAKIDNQHDFVLIGYSFGGILVQEMHKYIQPLKTILIASVKDLSQIPNYFAWGKKVHVERLIKPWIFNERIMTFVLQKWIYKTKDQIHVKEILPFVEPLYMRWAIAEILKWAPNEAD